MDDSTTNKMLLVMDYLEGGPVMTREGLGEWPRRGWEVTQDIMHAWHSPAVALPAGTLPATCARGAAMGWALLGRQHLQA